MAPDGWESGDLLLVKAKALLAAPRAYSTVHDRTPASSYMYIYIYISLSICIYIYISLSLYIHM